MYFKVFWEKKILFSVQTPFEFLQNMAIESIIARQDETTRYISDFTITLKQMRFATLGTAPGAVSSPVKQSGTLLEEPQATGRAAEQSQPTVNVGNMPGLAPTYFNSPGPLSLTTIQEKLAEMAKLPGFKDGGF